jgi:hypothetical protein
MFFGIYKYTTEETSVKFFGDNFDDQNDNVYGTGGSISHDFLLIRRL